MVAQDYCHIKVSVAIVLYIRFVVQFVVHSTISIRRASNH